MGGDGAACGGGGLYIEKWGCGTFYLRDELDWSKSRPPMSDTRNNTVCTVPLGQRAHTRSK